MTTIEHETEAQRLEREHNAALSALAASLEEIVNGAGEETTRQFGFVLLLFPFNQSGVCDFISNTDDRAGMIRVLRDVTAKLEAIEAAPEGNA
jgi:hypothetical protein